MPASEIVAIVTACTSILAVILAFLPEVWKRRKFQAEARTESANETKVRAEAATILVDTTMTLATRLDGQVQALIVERDKLRGEYEQLHTDVAKTQEQLAIMSAQFETCKQTLDRLAAEHDDRPTDTIDRR